MDVLYGFLSYSHADDDAECGRIRHLGNDIASEYGLLTGQEIHLFIDKKDLQWGDVWEDVIGDNLAKAAFFIPIITPRFFASAACRKELNDFSLKADKLGLGDLILPIYYATYAGLESEESGDSLVASVSSRQWIDWRPLRFSERTSPEYRQKINDLATRLVSANSASERTAIRFSSSGLETESQTLLPSNEDETAGSDGILDTLAAMEASFPELEKCVERIAAVVSDIGSEAQKATAAMNKPLGGTPTFANRLITARGLANDLAPLAEGLLTEANSFVEALHHIDDGIRIVVRNCHQEVRDDPSSEESFRAFFEALRSMVKDFGGALGGIADFRESLAALSKMSRDLRPPLRRLEQGLTLLTESEYVVNEWVEMAQIAEDELKQ